MSILWCGGEDIDCVLFTGVAQASASYYRTGYARCALELFSTQSLRSNTFSGGQITSGWVTCLVKGNASFQVMNRIFGFTQSGGNKGIYVGTNNFQFYLCKYDSTAETVIATESGSSWTPGVLLRLDLQIINYGASGTINLFLNGASILSYTGNLSISGVSGFDSVGSAFQVTSGFQIDVSEIIVANEDTRGFVGLATMAPTGAGTTDQWNGVYSTINGITLSDASPVYTNTVAQDEQFNVTDLPSGAFTIKAVKITARSAVSSPTPTATKISLGYNSGGTVAVGSALTPTVAFASLEQINDTNPVTGNPFLQSEMNGLQINLRSS